MGTFPIIKLEIQGMRAVVHQALTEHAAKLDETIKAEVDHCLSDKNVSETIARAVASEFDRLLTVGVKEALEYSFRYGPGQALLREAIVKAITPVEEALAVQGTDKL